MVYKTLLRSAVLAVALLANSTSYGGVWGSAYEGAAGTHDDITNSTIASLIDDHIRDQRQNVRYRLEVEHIFGDGDGLSDDNGLHRVGSGRCYMQDEPPTTLNDSHSTAGVSDYINTGTGSGAAGLEDSSSQSAAGAEDDIGHGRCWIDTNDGNKLYFFHGEAGDNTPATLANGWIPATGTGHNLILNGSFEATDGDGDSTATVVPIGWSLSSLPTISYVATPVTEGTGLAVRTTSTSTDDGIVQTLTGLRSASIYRVSARVLPTTDVCQIVIAGDDSTHPSIGEVDSASTGSYEGLDMLFTTDATPTDVTITLRGVGATAVCDWDNVVVESFEGANPPGSLVFKASYSGTTACDLNYTGTCADIVTVDVLPPGPGYYALIHWAADCNPGASAHIFNTELHDGTSQLEERVVDWGPDDSGNWVYEHIYMSNTALPVTGTIFAINVKRVSQTCDATEAYLNVLLISSGS